MWDNLRLYENFISKNKALFLLLLIVSSHSALLAWSVTLHAPTIDEPFHLAAGIHRLKTGQFEIDKGNTPLSGFIGAIGALANDVKTDWNRIPNTFAVGLDLLRVNRSQAAWILFCARWAMIPISIFGALLCYQWAAQMYGPTSGLIACTLWCFSPNILGNGSLVTGDVTATTMTLFTAYAFARWLEEPKLGRACILGIALGLAEVSKYAMVFLLPLLPFLWVVSRIVQTVRKNEVHWFRDLVHLSLAFLFAVEVINASYLFEGTFSPVEDYAISKHVTKVLPESMEFINKFPVPLPKPYIEGITEISGRVKVQPTSYINGKRQVGGFAYYYPLASLYKLPDGLLILLLLSTILFFAKVESRSTMLNELTLLFILIGFVTFVSAVGVGQRFRYVLPMMPFLFIHVSRIAKPEIWKARWLKISSMVFLAWVVTASLWIYPHSLSYFSWISGGAKQGHKHLVDSNLDWGQDLFFLKEWYDQHPDARPLHVAYFGAVDPGWAGIKYQLPPKFHDDANRKVHIPFEKQGPLPGWYAISVSYLRGTPWAVPNGNGEREYLKYPFFKYFLKFEPVDRIGYSTYIYHITDEQANKVRAELNMPPVP